MAKTRESFDNYYDEINKDLYDGYNEKLENYLNEEYGDKWNFHIKFVNESYYPLTILGSKKELEKLKKENEKYRYYVKEKNGSYGRDIVITRNPYNFFKNSDQLNRYVIQREIKSDLCNKRKYDYRIYVLMLRKGDEMCYYYYKKYVIRNCLEEYDEKSLGKYSNITNHHIYSLKKLDKNFYVLNEDFERDDSSKIERLNKKIIKKLKKDDKFYMLMINNNFRILGLDYVVEKDTRKLYVLEINTKPGVYYPDVKEDYMIKYNNFHKNIVRDLNNILIDNKSCENNWIKV